MKVNGAVIVMIGAAHGIGKVTVDVLLQQGAKVFFGDIDQSAAEAALKEFQNTHGEGRVFFKKCDIRQKEDIQGLFKAAISRWGRIDVFCPMAGICREAEWEQSVDVNLGALKVIVGLVSARPLAQMTSNDLLRFLWTVNQVGSIQSVKEVMKHMAKDEGGAGGAIVIVSSLQGFLIFPYSPVYAATKSALISFTRAMGSDESFSHHGIRFNCLVPGYIDVPFVHCPDEIRWLYDPEQAVSHLMGMGYNRVRPSTVSTALVRCVEDETMRGQSLFIDNDQGYDLIKRLDFQAPSEVILAKIDPQQHG